LQKNTAHVLTLFALSNLWMARRHLMGTGASECSVRRKNGAENVTQHKPMNKQVIERPGVAAFNKFVFAG
jgi:hypothetical protein